MLHNELRFQDPVSFRNFTRMDAEVFTKLLTIIENDIRRQDTNMRESIKPRDRLAVTLRFLATGETFQSLAYATRIAPNTLSQIIPDTLQAILNNLEDTCIKLSLTAGGVTK
ncbi:uncharacterized protein LOC126263279 [Schistocerca nitens]|uniref:uncharacterized protein LOC126263279 n=1 Tax=Schistocerca nitens TaxID=7011 RepID=UPI0021180F2C|nr:uncharacterized protein LOC126263279 [Schistocerca nitens]